MALTRRNTIVGLGALAAGAGVIGGTGAFTTVEADRDVELAAAGDADANLALFVANDDLGDNNEVISLDIDGLNLQAITTYDNAVFIGNDGTEEVAISIRSSGSEEYDLTDGSQILEFSAGSDDYDLEAHGDHPSAFGNDDLVENLTLGSGEGVMLDLSIDLMAYDEVGNENSGATEALEDVLEGEESITIVAEATE